jgi:tRNA(Ile)-lysidine synthase
VRRARPERALEGRLRRGGRGARGRGRCWPRFRAVPTRARWRRCLARHAAERGARLTLGHVNHAVRPTADRDEGVVLALGAALGARVMTRRLAAGPAVEARLREARYAALVSAAREAGATRDLHRPPCRGPDRDRACSRSSGASGPLGLAGMAPDRALARGVRLVRPLLGVPKARLVAYCAERRLPYAVDPTNAELGFRRNALAPLARRTAPDLPQPRRGGGALGRDRPGRA